MGISKRGVFIYGKSKNGVNFIPSALARNCQKLYVFHQRVTRSVERVEAFVSVPHHDEMTKYLFLVHHLPVRGDSGHFVCPIFSFSFIAIISMLAPFNVRRVAPYRRLTFSALTFVSLFLLTCILATTPIIGYITRHPFFTQYTHHDDQVFFQALHSDGEEGKPSNQISDLKEFCSPENYSEGYWLRRPESLLRPMLTPEDVYPISGFQGCASSREVNWHLAKEWQDDEEARSRPWRGNVSAYDWIPGSGCESYSKPTQEQLVAQLVERGGWLILGDSISENHFFSLSCMLYPHVRATPDYTSTDNFDRAWQQDLFLEKTSPLVPYLRFPTNFDIDKTPLVTFRRVDLLLGKSELVSIYENSTTFDKEDSAKPDLFSEEGVWDLDPDTYIPLFLNPLPSGNYNTMIVSTAGHWTTSLFNGFHNENVDGNGLANLLQFFEKAMERWLEHMEQALDDANLKAKKLGAPQKQVIVRAYHPGHDGCHEISTLTEGPVKTYESSMSHSYNWGWIRRYNDVFKSLTQKRNHSNVHFLSIETPALLRPDGHVTGDCLHIVTGAGILEGWSQYISYSLNFLP